MFGGWDATFILSLVSSSLSRRLGCVLARETHPWGGGRRERLAKEVWEGRYSEAGKSL